MKNNTLLHAKHIFLAFFIVAVSASLSCSKDDKEPITNDSRIEGTWQLVSFTYDGYFEVGETRAPITGTAKDIDNVKVTFNSDGTVTSNGAPFTFVLTGKENPDEKLEFPTEMFEEGGSWEKDGNTLYITDFLSEDGRMGVPIAELNATTLHLSGSVTGSEDAITNVAIRFTRSN